MGCEGFIQTYIGMTIFKGKVCKFVFKVIKTPGFKTH